MVPPRKDIAIRFDIVLEVKTSRWHHCGGRDVDNAREALKRQAILQHPSGAGRIVLAWAAVAAGLSDAEIAPGGIRVVKLSCGVTSVSRGESSRSR